MRLVGRRERHVLGLEVAVNELQRVQLLQDEEELVRQLVHHAQAEAGLGWVVHREVQQVEERVREQLEDEAEVALVLERALQPHQVRRARARRLLQALQYGELASPLREEGGRGADDLERDEGVRGQQGARLDHLPEAALAQHLQHLVAAQLLAQLHRVVRRAAAHERVLRQLLRGLSQGGDGAVEREQRDGRLVQRHSAHLPRPALRLVARTSLYSLTRVSLPGFSCLASHLFLAPPPDRVPKGRVRRGRGRGRRDARQGQGRGAQGRWQGKARRRRGEELEGGRQGRALHHAERRWGARCGLLAGSALLVGILGQLLALLAQLHVHGVVGRRHCHPLLHAHPLPLLGLSLLLLLSPPLSTLLMPLLPWGALLLLHLDLDHLLLLHLHPLALFLRERLQLGQGACARRRRGRRRRQALWV